jgi:predicted unusual protein kinase regulating ubiquinone biosynthesis (AarF/ABC1/UbiB family)
LSDLKHIFKNDDTSIFPTILKTYPSFIIETYIDAYSSTNFLNTFGDKNYVSAKILTMVSFLKMVNGKVIHGDFHNGNILYNVIDGKIKVCFIDFGLVTRITSIEKNMIKKLINGCFTLFLTNKMDQLIQCIFEFSNNKVSNETVQIFSDKLSCHLIKVNDMYIFDTSQLNSIFSLIFIFMKDAQVEFRDNILYATLSFLLIENDISKKYNINSVKMIKQYLNKHNLIHLL